VRLRLEYPEATFINGTGETMQPRPFVKWAGGKSQLVEQLAVRMPERYSAYHEPFVGGGALFFYLTPDKAFLSDLNEELVNAFLVVKNDCEALLRSLKQHKNNAGYYYRIRALDPGGLDPVERASRFIYLNKTCYNGLYRVNRQGKFNVPFGRYKNPNYADEIQLCLASNALQHADIKAHLFRKQGQLSARNLSVPGLFSFGRLFIHVIDRAATCTKYQEKNSL